MPNFKIIAFLLLGSTDSGGYVKLTPKYMIVGGEGGESNFFLKVPIIFFWYLRTTCTVSKS